MASSDTDWSDAQQVDEFHRAVSLHYDCVADVLRKVLHQRLVSKGMPFSDYLDRCRRSFHGKKFITEATLQDMDISMLTMLLLERSNIAGISPKESGHIEKLRDYRNELAHNRTDRLIDRGLFKKSCHDVTQLSLSLSVPVQEELQTRMDELQQREFIRRLSTLELLEISKERLKLVLIKTEKRKEHTDEYDELVLKYNLAKWAKHVSRCINVHLLLHSLRKANVISSEVFDKINNADNECEKGPMLVDYFIKEKDRTDILILCQKIRKSHAPYVADLLEGNSSDGQNAEKCIREDMEIKVTKLLKEIIEFEEGASETAENIHIRVEEDIGRPVEFSVVNSVMECVFQCPETDGRYDGVSLRRRPIFEDKCLKKEEERLDIAAMSLEEYADYVGNEFRYINEETCHRISSQIKTELIKMEDFVELTDEELSELFSSCMESQRLEMGVKKRLKKIQNTIKGQINVSAVTTKTNLRPFDKVSRISYEKTEVSYGVLGDLHNPAHEMVYPANGKLRKHFLMKASVRFIAACINGRKNGTLHFGLKRIHRNKAEIIGIKLEEGVFNAIDSIIDEGIERCFSHLDENRQRNIKKCVRPAQIIPIKEHEEKVVEIDIIPSHIYLGGNLHLYVANFPPNGRQSAQVFIMDDNKNCEIGVLNPERLESMHDYIQQIVEERRIADLRTQRNAESARKLSQKLIDQLTNGADYITDEFFPIIVSGKVVEKENEFIFQLPGLKDAFQNSVAVFDFNSSTELRRKVEEGNPIFQVKTTEEIKADDDSVLETDKEKLWIYCNGNDDHKGCSSLESKSWVLNRKHKIENVLLSIKRRIPPKRAKLIILVLEEMERDDPIIEFATSAFTGPFQNACTIIAATNDDINTLQNELATKVGFENVTKFMFYGLTWEMICKVFRKVFKESSGDSFRIPNSAESFEEITTKEKDKWTDLEILSLDECQQDYDKMTSEEKKLKSSEEMKRFYSGQGASWWNFFFKHTCERDLFKTFKKIVERRLRSHEGKMLVEWFEIKHHPGAGGSTLGRHLLWYFSQERCTSKPYRCCVVKQLSENTFHQIENFRDFKDKKPRPVVILLDQVMHEHLLFEDLQRLAYKIASPGELFGLVIQVSRVSLHDDNLDDSPENEFPDRIPVQILQQKLGGLEKVWFDQKYKELEKDTDENLDVHTLLAFNFLRNDFSPEHMKKTVTRIMTDAKEFEIDILKILAVVCNYKTGTLVPECIFDSLVPVANFPGIKDWGKPFGMRSRNLDRQPPEILKSRVLGLFVCRAGHVSNDRGLSIICQPLANVILEHIKTEVKVDLEEIVMDILKHMALHTERPDCYESLRFVEIVCSLFKTRVGTEKRKDGTKEKFSLLINALLKDKKDEDKTRVIRLMNECFSLSQDAFVGQQIARFHIKHKKLQACRRSNQQSDYND